MGSPLKFRAVIGQCRSVWGQAGTRFYSTSVQRQTLEHYIHKFHKLNKKEKLRIIIFDIDIDIDESVHLNTTLPNAVQILSWKPNWKKEQKFYN